MTHLGTFEAGSDFTLISTLNDQDGTVVDLKSGGDATVTGFVERNGAIYLNDRPITLNADADGNPVSWLFEDTDSNKLPAGNFKVLFKAVLSSAAVRRWRDSFTIVRGSDV